VALELVAPNAKVEAVHHEKNEKARRYSACFVL
jgi:hypothetical protein